MTLDQILNLPMATAFCIDQQIYVRLPDPPKGAGSGDLEAQGPADADDIGQLWVFDAWIGDFRPATDAEAMASWGRRHPIRVRDLPAWVQDRSAHVGAGL